MIFLSGLLACKKENKSIIRMSERDIQLTNPLSIGGEFTLTDHNNKPFHLKDLRGNLVLLFFGYTYCPEICPTMMNKINEVYNKIGLLGKKVKTLFITVDPERDTPERMKTFLSIYLAVDSIGLTGTRDQLAQIAKKYTALFPKEVPKQSQHVMHSTYLYLINQSGKVIYIIRYSDTAKFIAKLIGMAMTN